MGIPIVKTWTIYEHYDKGQQPKRCVSCPGYLSGMATRMAWTRFLISVPEYLMKISLAVSWQYMFPHTSLSLRFPTLVTCQWRYQSHQSTGQSWSKLFGEILRIPVDRWPPSTSSGWRSQVAGSTTSNWTTASVRGLQWGRFDQFLVALDIHDIQMYNLWHIYT